MYLPHVARVNSVLLDSWKRTVYATYTLQAAAEPSGLKPKLRDPEAADKAKVYIEALGGRENIKRVDACAETRLRVELADEGTIDQQALMDMGATGLMKAAEKTLHIVVGLNADQYAAEMRGQMA